jgi:hypothetical protein
MARGILELSSRFLLIGTSQFVLEEFDAVVGGLYRTMSGAVKKLTGQSRPRAFNDLWAEASHLLPVYVPGGGKLLAQIVAGLGVRYGEREISPVEVANFLDGQKSILLELVSLGHDPRQPMEIFDLSSCCLWSKPPSESCVEPAEHCRLKILCIDRRDAFMAAVTTLAKSSREEAAWLRRNISDLRSVEDLDFMRIVAGHPAHFGDIIIFMEVPDEWTLLTRDRTFMLLNKQRRKGMSIYYLRLPRIRSGQKCSVRNASINGAWVEAVLVNWTALDACISTRARLGSRGSEVVVSASEFDGERVGRVSRVEQRPEGYLQGIRFLSRPPPP